MLQRSAGAGSKGQQFIPRIGQEVLAGFINNDRTSPLCLPACTTAKAKVACQLHQAVRLSADTSGLCGQHGPSSERPDEPWINSGVVVNSPGLARRRTRQCG